MIIPVNAVQSAALQEALKEFIQITKTPVEFRFDCVVFKDVQGFSRCVNQLRFQCKHGLADLLMKPEGVAKA